MADILIRMDMPRSCELCNMRETVGRDEWMCKINRKEFPSWEAGWNGEEYRHPECPLHELPPHGDLIDRDALYDSVRLICTLPTDIPIDNVILAPVVIPAENGGDAP